ncbi:WW domain-containing oxidoreductase [Gracilariopsis chorda]|uniref:WW domain-containing oxidoreductase n=1 Tax=Gracilariopsis chorda TaxID=448386 RepID=A0A2V3IGE5_9FLOR|nr:WW domain-containing oxidoreductase [Gracilariopsis chorda]|eukprot:PXF41147.1 WW domain-containing oxidoreductase [Gracilariopsis chorda]
MAFTIEGVPPQTGKVVIITGASSGIGLEAARVLAKKGAHVIMACRNLGKSQPLADEINSECAETGGKATLVRLDTTDLDSIDSFSNELQAASITQLDVLLLNAGIMMVQWATRPSRSELHPEIESQMSCNVVGHFYLVQKMLPLIRSTPGARVITVSSLAADQTNPTDSINYDVFLAKTPEEYSKMNSYCESKLSCLLLAHELDRRFKQANIDAFAISAHPGYSRTSLQPRSDSFLFKIFLYATLPFSMKAEGGGLVLSMAATADRSEIPPNPYFTPGGFQGLSGAPIANGKMCAHARDDAQAFKLWETCEELCAVTSDI